jgi:hypothetical protein
MPVFCVGETMSNPTPTDVHIPVPMDGKKKRAPREPFLSRLYASLKERWSGGGFLSAEDFATVFKSARGTLVARPRLRSC